MPESSSSPSQVTVLPAALLFEDNSVLIETPSGARKNGEEEDIIMKDEEVDSGLGDETYPPESTSPDDSASASPSVDGGSRMSTTPPASTKPKGKPQKKEPQLIGDLPRAEENAMQTFTQIPENNYQFNSLGRSREALESMTCDCQYEHGQ